jgi:double-stranded uracil-DNA glycosylase
MAQVRKCGLPKVVGHDPAVLILGSFPGEQALARAEYYGNPQNHFWGIIERLFGIQRDLPYHERIARLTDRHIALWDTIRSCTREGSGDDRIRNSEPEEVIDLIRSYPTIRLVALNGKTAEKNFYRMLHVHGPLPGVIVCTFPSTSPANARYSFEEKVRQWEMIREFAP